MHHGNAAWLVLALLAAGASSAVSQPLSPASPVEGPASQLLEPPVSNGLGPEPAAVEPPTFALDFGEAAPEPSASSLGSLPAGSPPPVLKHPPPGRHSPPPPLHRRPPPLRASSPPYGQNFVLPSMISVASPGVLLPPEPLYLPPELYPVPLSAPVLSPPLGSLPPVDTSTLLAASSQPPTQTPPTSPYPQAQLTVGPPLAPQPVSPSNGPSYKLALGPITDGCPALLAAVPAACPNFQALITALGSNLDPTQAQLGEAALTNPPDQDCCSAYRGFYSADDGKKGCSCAPSILRVAQEFGITEQGFETVYKAVNIGCAYLGSTYATGFLSSKCPPVSTYGSVEG